MGATNSKIEEDKALQLCRERKRFVRQALDGRCSLAATHVAYIQSLRSTGTALRKFIEPEAPVESSLYTSTNATPEPLALTEKSFSHFSYSSPTISQHVDATENISLSPSPPPISTTFQVNHMKFSSSYSREVQEKPLSPVTGTVTFSGTPPNNTPRSIEQPETPPFDNPSITPGTPSWDYFGFFHPIDNQFSFQDGKELEMNQAFENADDVMRLRKEEGIPDLEEYEEKASSCGSEELQDSEDEFDEPSTDTLVRRFENVNRVTDQGRKSSSPATTSAMPSAGSVASETEFATRERGDSPDLSSSKDASSAVGPQVEMKKTPNNQNDIGPKDFLSSMKDIEFLFIKASDSGKEVPRMLEANKLHFRPMFRGRESVSVVSLYIKACFSCGQDRRQVQEEPAQAAIKYLTWPRTTSSRSFPSLNPLGLNSRDDNEELTTVPMDTFGMISGSHASTLDRLYAWERKLYDEVKASEMVRRYYDLKCNYLRQLESRGQTSQKIDKTRAAVKDLYSRIKVAIHKIDSISKRIEELRDKELQPQLEELIVGLSRMWEVMFECHRLQYQIISVAYPANNSKVSTQSELRRQITIHLENELSSLSSCFVRWIGAQKSYLQAINNWLSKCAPLQEKTSRRKRRLDPSPPWKNRPPIYATCGSWLKKLEDLPTKQVEESIKILVADTRRFLPRQETNQGKGAKKALGMSWEAESGGESSANLIREDASEDWMSDFDRFRPSLVDLLGRLNEYSKHSVDMYSELGTCIQEAKSEYEKLKSSGNN